MKCINRRIITNLATGIAIWVIIGIIAFLSVHKTEGAWMPNLGFQTPLNAILGQKQAPQRSATDVLVDRLAECESGGDWNAYNPKDLDNTPSIGKFQFKTGTWYTMVKKYNMWNSKDWDNADFGNNIWDGNYQTEVVKRMFTDPQVDLRHEFPSCSKLLGLKKNYMI